MKLTKTEAKNKTLTHKNAIKGKNELVNLAVLELKQQ